MKIKCIYLIILALVLRDSGSLLRADENILWGSAKDGVKVGIIQHGWAHSRNGVIDIYITRTTNYMDNLVLPEHDTESFECTLLGTNSLTVKKTVVGQHFGATLQTNMSKQRARTFELKTKSWDGLKELAFFQIDKAFIVPEDGNYELEIRAKLLKKSANSLIPVLFEPIKLKLHLASNADQNPP